MIASVKEHGVLNPVIVQKLDAGYEMLSGHNRWNAAKLAEIKEIPAIVKTDLSEEEAYVYVIETNLMQRSFSDLAISEKAAVLKARYEKLKSVVACVRSGIPVHRAGPTDLFYYLMGNLGWWK